MKNKIKLILLLMVVSVSIGLGTNAAVKPKSVNHNIKIERAATVKPANVEYMPVNSLDVVANPAKYLNKRVKIKAQFDKFSTLGLDYKPAYKSSEKYITFLIKRDDVLNHIIPLSEMKIFLERSEAEKYIDLSSGDQIEFSGVVFSDALGDAWIDVEKFTVLTQKSKEQNSNKK